MNPFLTELLLLLDKFVNALWPYFAIAIGLTIAIGLVCFVFCDKRGCFG